MYYSYNWLKELTKTKKNQKELSEMIMLKGFELEGKEELEERFKNITVGQIKKIEKHPDADKLQLVEVEVGEKNGGVLKIVCGAHNIEVNDKIPVALIGSIIPQKKFKIEKTKICGEVSNGMLCAEDELGVGKDHSGILILDDDVKVGDNFSKALKIKDTVLEFDILPDRAHDCLSYQGLAREICAMEGRKLEIKNKKLDIVKRSSKMLDVEIEDRKLCSRYIGAVLDNIRIKPSPKWMQNRLIASGMEPINNIVDITNYVMLEIGSPLHAFDFNNVEGEIVVRSAEKDECLELLDNTKLKLDKKDLVIADSKKAIGLAGIKGGKYSGISNETTRVILEAANFDQFNIRKTRQRHGLSTEAQLRFEKGISPMLAQDAVVRTVELFKEYAEAELIDYVDEFSSNEKNIQVNLDFESVDSLLGFETDKEMNVKILEDLGFEILKKDKKFIQVGVPYWRLDIENQEDLIEEIGRIIGYEKIEEKSIRADVSVPKINERRKLEWKSKDLLVGLGFDEMINYSFYSKKDAQFCNINGEHYEILKPFSEEIEILRKTLLIGLLKNVLLNESYFDEFNLFEVGRTYKVKDYPEEESRIAGIEFSKEKKIKGNFYSLKNKVESFLEKITGGEINFEKKAGEGHGIFNSNESAGIRVGEKEIGIVGIVDEKLLNFYKIKGSVCGFEISFEKLFEEMNSKKEYQSLQKFPNVRRDLSMFVDAETEAEKVINIFKKQGKEYFKSAELFDIFCDKKTNKKSLAFHLIFGSDERTLTNKEVDKIIKLIIDNLQKKGTDIRK